MNTAFWQNIGTSHKSSPSPESFLYCCVYYICGHFKTQNILRILLYIILSLQIKKKELHMCVSYIVAPYLPFLLLFSLPVQLSICIIFLQSNGLILDCFIVPFSYQQILSGFLYFEKVSISLSFLKNDFAGYRNLVWFCLSALWMAF